MTVKNLKFHSVKKKVPNTCLFFPLPILFWGFGEVRSCRCMRDNIIYGRHETTCRVCWRPVAPGALFLTLHQPGGCAYDWQYFLDGPKRRFAEIGLLFDLCWLHGFAAWCLVLVKYAICNKTNHKTWRVSYTLVMVWNIKELCVSSTFLLWTCASFWRLHAAHFSLSLVVTTSAIARGVSVGFKTESNTL